MENQTLISALTRLVTVTPPVYGQEETRVPLTEFVADLSANNYRKLTTTPGMLVDLEKKAIRYINANIPNSSDPKRVAKNMAKALAKKVPFKRFLELLEVMTTVGSFNLGQPEPKQAFVPTQGLESAVHKIAAPKLREICTICDEDFTTNVLCVKCVATMHIIKHTKGYHDGKFKNQAQAIRRYRAVGPAKFGQYIVKKKDFKPQIQRPIVAGQPERDFDLASLVDDEPMLSRSARRMEEYIAKIKAEVKNIEQHGDFSDGVSHVISKVYEVVKKAYDSGYLTLAACAALVAGSLTVIVVSLIRSKSVDEILTILSVAVPLLATLVAVGFMGSFFEKLHRFFVELVDRLKQIKETNEVELTPIKEVKRNHKEKASDSWETLDSSKSIKLNSAAYIYPPEESRSNNPFDSDFSDTTTAILETITIKRGGKARLMQLGLPEDYIDAKMDFITSRATTIDEFVDEFIVNVDGLSTPVIKESYRTTEFSNFIQKTLKRPPTWTYDFNVNQGGTCTTSFTYKGEIYAITSRPRVSKGEARDDAARIALPLAQWLIPPLKVTPHGETELPEKVKESVEKSAISAIVSSAINFMAEGVSSIKSAILPSTMSFIHTCATAIRDVKSIVEVLQPAVETIVGGFYEHVLKQPWIPWSQRDIVELMKPIQAEHEELSLDGERTANIHARPDYQERVEKFVASVKKLEETLMRTRVPPRYLLPVAKMRNDAELWQQLIVAAKKTAHDRMEPVGVMVFGAPGVGKSTMLKQLCVDLAQDFHALDSRHPKEWNDNMWFTKKVDTETWDGYKNQPVIVFDDIYQTTNTEKRTSESMMIVSVINRAAFMCPMADLPDKGTTYIQPMLVLANRNGVAKLSNIGITSLSVITRRFPIHCEMLTGGDPTDPATWRFQLYNQACQPVGETIDYMGLLKMTRALLVAKHQESVATVKPVGEREEMDYAALGKEILNSHRASAQRVELDDVVSSVAKGFKNKRKARINQHGSASSSGVSDEDLDAVLEHEKDVLRLQDLIDTGKCTIKEMVTMYEAMREKALSLGHKVPLLVLGAKEHILRYDIQTRIENHLKEMRTQIADTFTSVRAWTLSKIDAATEWIVTTKQEISVAVFNSFFVNIFEHARTKFMKWIQGSALAKVCVAIGAVALIAGIVGGVYYLVSSKEPEMEAHSRSEKEDKRDRERAKDRDFDREHRPRIKGGRAHTERDGMHNKEGKLLPRRMRKHADVEEHLYESEMPLISSLSRNIYELSYNPGDAVAHGQVVMLRGTIGVTCLHVVRYMKQVSVVTLKQVFTLNDKTSTLSMDLPVPNIVHVPDTEIVFLDFGRSLPLAADITHHFMNDEDIERAMEYGLVGIRMIYRDREGTRQIVESNTGTIDVHSGLHTNDNNVPYLAYVANTTGGSSGGLTMTSSPVFERKVVGIHTGAAERTAYDAIITREMIEEFAPPAHSLVIVPHVGLTGDEVVSPKNQTTPLGKLSHPHSSGGKNQIAPSPLAPHLRTDPVYPMQTLTIPTIMFATDPRKFAERWVREGMINMPSDVPEHVDPLRTAYAVAPPFKHLNQDLMELAWRDTTVPQFPRGYFILSPEDAVFGVPELGVAPIDFTTSAGYNWANIPGFNRYTLFGINKNAVQRTKFEDWHPAMKAGIIDMLTAISKDQMPLNIVVDSLKAERRKVARALQGNTRLFYAGSIVWLVVSRMFTVCLTVHEKETPTVSIPAVGIIPTSNQWKEVYMRINVHPNKIVLDKKNFDMHNQAALTDFLGRKTAQVCLRGKVTVGEGFVKIWKEITGDIPTIEQIGWGIHAAYLSSCYAIHIAGSVAYIDTQTTNSGVDRTSQINSQRNDLGTRMTFISILRDAYDELPESFQRRMYSSLLDDHLQCVFYGDDQILSLSDELAQFATKYTYAQATHAVLGDQVTNPDKSPVTEDAPFDSWETVEILKRGFRWDAGILLAPLQRSVIEDSLFWVTRASTAHSIAADTVRSALLEAALHGEEYYNTLYGVCERACKLASVKFDPPKYRWVIDMYVRK